MRLFHCPEAQILRYAGGDGGFRENGNLLGFRARGYYEAGSETVPALYRKAFKGHPRLRHPQHDRSGSDARDAAVWHSKLERSGADIKRDRLHRIFQLRGQQLRKLFSGRAAPHGPPPGQGNRGVPDEAVKGRREEGRRESYRKLSVLLFFVGRRLEWDGFAQLKTACHEKTDMVASVYKGQHAS